MPQARIFNYTNMTFNAIRENKILANISEFTVTGQGLTLEQETLTEYGYEIPQLHTADQPTAPRGRATEQ